MIAAPVQEQQLEVWQPGNSPLRIEYPRGLMEELRLLAVDGFSRLSHGGVEIGGVLFGRHEPGTVCILAHRPLSCEYAFGPSFTLSDKDRRALEQVLASAAGDPELAELQVVGWYHSHTRKEILLTEKDIELFDRHFPQAWQIALVLRPRIFDPTRAGFFFREADGAIQSQASYREFVIGQPASAPAADPPESDPPESDPDEHLPALRQEAEVLRLEPPPVPAAVPAREGQRLWMLAAALAAALVVAAALVWTWHGSPAGLSLRVFDTGGQLRIDWNRNAPAILQAQSGALEIEDGPAKLHNELDLTQLRAGSVTYVRSSGDVLVRLLVRLQNQATATEVTQFLGPPVEAPPEEANSADRVAPAEEDMARTRAGLERQAKVADRLQQELERMARQVRREPANRMPATRVFRPAVQAPESRARSGEPLPAAPPVPSNTMTLTATAVPVLPEIEKVPQEPRRAAKPAYQGPSSGTLLWTGRLARHATVQILNRRASAGHLTGALPGIPVRVRAFAAELTSAGLRVYGSDPGAESIPPEAPGAQNGWNRTVYVWNPRQAGAIRLVESPGPENDWSRMAVRAEKGDYSIIVLRWELLPPETAAR